MIRRLAGVLALAGALAASLLMAAPALAQIPNCVLDVNNVCQKTVPTAPALLTPVPDGQGNVPRPISALVMEGQPIEGAAASLTSSSPTSQPWSLTGLQGITLNLGGTFSGVVTVQENPAFNPASPTTGWVTDLACTASNGTLTAGTVSGPATISCPNQGMPIQLNFTTATSGTVAVTASTYGASAAAGVPFEPSWAAWNAMTIHTKLAGLSVPVNQMTEVFSTVAGEPGYNGLGLCSAAGVPQIVTDTNAIGDGQSTLYSLASVGGVTFDTPSSSPNPWGCSNGMLTFTEEWTGSRWTAGRLDLMDRYYQQNLGFAAPPTRFYAEVTMIMPSAATVATLGFDPWIAPVWMSDCNNYPYNTDSTIPLTPSKQGCSEFDPCETGIAPNAAGSSTDPYSSCVSHVHEYGPAQELGANEPGYISAARAVASPAYACLCADGAQHKYGLWSGDSYWASAQDRVTNTAALKPGLKMSSGREHIQIQLNPNSPTAAHTATLTFYIVAIRVWTWSGPQSPIPQLSVLERPLAPANDGETIVFDRAG